MSIHRKENVNRFSKKHYNSNGIRTGYSRPGLFGGEIHYDRKGRRIGVSSTETKSSYDSFADETSEEYDLCEDAVEEDSSADSCDFMDESDDITDFLDAIVDEMDSYDGDDCTDFF